MDISVVIPTKDRFDDLIKCVDSVTEQSLVPIELIIIDDGKLSDSQIDNLKKTIQAKKIVFKYIKKDIPGLSASRNLGASMSQCPVVLYLDDDVILDKEYVSVLSNNWEEHKDDEHLCGVSGIISNMRKFSLLSKIFHGLFFLYSKTPWDITEVGFQVWSTDIKKKLQRVYYLPGGISSIRKDIIEKIGFRQLSPGRTPSDDVEFFLRAKKLGYYCIIDPQARLIHNHAKESRENEYHRGVKEGYNQYVIFKNNVNKTLLNYFLFLWSSIGWILRQFLAGNLSKASGMIMGYVKGQLKCKNN